MDLTTSCLRHCLCLLLWYQILLVAHLPSCLSLLRVLCKLVLLCQASPCGLAGLSLSHVGTLSRTLCYHPYTDGLLYTSASKLSSDMGYQCLLPVCPNSAPHSLVFFQCSSKKHMCLFRGGATNLHTLLNISLTPLPNFQTTPNLTILIFK